jgi:hypothetical protein
MSSQGYSPKLSFEASPVLWEFVQSDAFVDGVMGPLGSGKSVACCAKLIRHALEQAPNRNNIRRSRWAVVRNTQPELKSTTIKTWLDVMPEENCGRLVYTSPITHRIKRPAVGDRPGIDIEIMFIALDQASDVKKLKSLELTGAWVNEATEVPVEVVQMLTGRVGRFPSAGSFGPEDDGVQATWAGIFMDTNASDDQSWWYKFAEGGDRPSEAYAWTFRKQPMAIIECALTGAGYNVSEPGFATASRRIGEVFQAGGRYWTVNPDAENLNNLRPGYYQQQIANKDAIWIQRYLQAKYVYMSPGSPWVPEYSDEIMSMQVPIDRELKFAGGLDIGGGTLQPAAVIGQRGRMGDIRVARELSMFDIGIDRFSDALIAFIHSELGIKHSEVEFWADPAGEKRDELFETSAIQHMRSKGFNVRAAPTNNIAQRRESLVLPMGRLINTGSGHALPGFLVDKSCTKLRAGLAGKWYRRRIQIPGSDRTRDEPEKNEWSHVCDAVGYLVMGLGEFRTLTHGADKPGSASSQSWRQQGAKAVSFADFNPLQ